MVTNYGNYELFCDYKVILIMNNHQLYIDSIIQFSKLT